jgi:putative ABC transport system ATP-binding protein
MAIVRASDLEKDYKTGNVSAKALNGVSLTIGEGEFTAIVGPSGSGKSTLLNLIGGLDRPTKGQVKVADTDLSTLSENKLIEFRLKNIGFVFQAYNLIPVLTAGENIEFNMNLLNIKSSVRKERAKELLAELGLSDKINRRPSQLSGGEQQRVAVARALAARPQFIIADEPTANLDSKATSTLLDLMHRMCEKEKTTFIFSTHDQRVIQKAKRVVSLVDGNIV